MLPWCTIVHQGSMWDPDYPILAAFRHSIWHYGYAATVDTPGGCSLDQFCGKDAPDISQKATPRQPYKTVNAFLKLKHFYSNSSGPNTITEITPRIHGRKPLREPKP